MQDAVGLPLHVIGILGKHYLFLTRLMCVECSGEVCSISTILSGQQVSTSIVAARCVNDCANLRYVATLRQTEEGRGGQRAKELLGKYGT